MLTVVGAGSIFLGVVGVAGAGRLLLSRARLEMAGRLQDALAFIFLPTHSVYEGLDDDPQEEQPPDADPFGASPSVLSN